MVCVVPVLAGVLPREPQETDSEFSPTVSCAHYLLAKKTQPAEPWDAAWSFCGTLVRAPRPWRSCGRISLAESRTQASLTVQRLRSPFQSRRDCQPAQGLAVPVRQLCALTRAAPAWEEGIINFVVVNESRRWSQHRAARWAWQLIPRRRVNSVLPADCSCRSVIIFRCSCCAALSDRSYCFISLQFC